MSPTLTCSQYDIELSRFFVFLNQKVKKSFPPLDMYNYQIFLRFCYLLTPQTTVYLARIYHGYHTVYIRNSLIIRMSHFIMVKTQKRCCCIKSQRQNQLLNWQKSIMCDSVEPQLQFDPVKQIAETSLIVHAES